MSNGILDELLNDPEAVFGDARIRTRFDTVAVNITGAEAVPSPDPDPELEDGQVKLQRSDAGDDIFDGEGAIADALDAASGGDTILVGPGTFEEVLTIATANIKLTCDSPDETTIVGRIVIEAGGVVVSNLEIESGGEIDEVIEVSVDVSGVTVVGCVFTVTTEGVRVIEIGNGDDITIEDCEFDIDVEIERVIFVRDGSNITIDGCEFEVVNEITITRFIVVEESAVDVTIVRCVFVGKVELEVIVLEADDSRIEGCDFDGVIKIDLTIQLVLIDADNVVVIDCDFEIDVELRRVILVRGGSDVTVDDCDFEIIDGVTIERLIVVNSNAVDVLIVRCVFIGSVTVTTIEHNGTGGGSAIRDCDFDEVELDDATLIIRVDDVTIEEVEIQIVEIQIKDEFEIFTSLSGAINAAEEGAKIIVRSGTYAEEDSITIATPDLEIRGPQAGTSGGDSSRSPNDPETEAIIESRVFIEDSDVVLDGFSLREGAAIDPFNPGKLAIDNNVINGANRTPIRDGISAFIFDGVDVSIIGNRISSSETGIRITSQATGSEFTDAVEIADNTIEETDTGIDLTDTAVPDGGIETVRANNTFRNTDTEVVPEL